MRWRFGRWKRLNDQDLEDEIAHDLAAEAAERVRAGVAPDEAERLSRRDFGNVTMVKEDTREMWSFTSLQRFAQDIRYGWRTLRKNPLFASMAVLSLALGIGANTAIFSLMDAIMLRALPVRNPGELVVLNWRSHPRPRVVHSHSGSSFAEPNGFNTSPDFPWPAYELFRDHNDVFTSLIAFKQEGNLTLVAHQQADEGDIEFVSGNFFSGLGVVPAAGRLLTESDNAGNAPPVAVLSYAYWRGRFAGDPAAVGQTVLIKNLPYTIAGVAAPEFFGVRPGNSPLLYVPMASKPTLGRNYGDEHETMFTDVHNYWIDMMGRLRPGVTLARAQAEMAGKFRPLVLASAEKADEKVNLPALWIEEGGSGIDSLRRRFSQPLLILMTMVAFILAIACANIANLLLARASARRREMAVRLSLGASRLRVVRQLLTESVMLALPGAILGLAIAAAGLRFLMWLFFGAVGEFFSLRVDLNWRVLAFTIAVALATGIIFGLAPAIQATQVDVTPALKETRADAQRGRRGRPGLSQFLVVAQIALSLLLVLGAALFVRTLANLQSIETGFNQQNLLTFHVDASEVGFKDAALRGFYASMQQHFRSLPGVRTAALSSLSLISNSDSSTSVRLAGAPKDESRDGPSSSYLQVSPAYFETMEIPLILGRSIDSHDVAGAPLAAVVNEVFARKYFPNRNPIGQRFTLGNSATGEVTIVGMAKSVRYSSLTEEVPPVSYVSYLQDIIHGPPRAMIFELRTAGDPLALAASVRKIVHDAAPLVPVTQIKTQVEIIDETISQQRTFADLCTAFAVLALAIACVGLYGAMAYAVSRRTNEIGIRMALGAERRGIVWMVLREVLALSAIGLILGLAGAWSAMSAIQSYLFGMKPADPLAMAAAIGILLSALLLAGYAPAARASRIDPISALRHE